MPDEGKCRSCGDAILWVKTSAGNVMPLNKEPDPEGNIVLVDGVARVLSGEMWEGHCDLPKYKSHFATCPGAAKHRKRTRQ